MISFFGTRTKMFFNNVSISSLFRPGCLIYKIFLTFCTALHGMDFRMSDESPSTPTAFPFENNAVICMRTDLHENWHCQSWFWLSQSLSFLLPSHSSISLLAFFFNFHLIILILLPQTSFQFVLPFLLVSRCQTIFFTLLRFTDQLIVLNSLHFLCDSSGPVFFCFDWAFLLWPTSILPHCVLSSSVLPHCLCSSGFFTILLLFVEWFKFTRTALDNSSAMSSMLTSHIRSDASSKLSTFFLRKSVSLLVCVRPSSFEDREALVFPGFFLLRQPRVIHQRPNDLQSFSTLQFLATVLLITQSISTDKIMNDSSTSATARSSHHFSTSCSLYWIQLELQFFITFVGLPIPFCLCVFL